MSESELARYADAHPDHAAVILAETGQRLSYGQLHARSTRLAGHLQSSLQEGDVIAILMTNRAEYFEVCFAARRAGLYYVPVSTHLTAAELGYLLEDSGAKLLITEARFDPLLAAMPGGQAALPRIMRVDGDAPGDLGDPVYADLVSTGELPALLERAAGLDFTYSSGTTGRPKGIRHPLRQSNPQLQAAVRNQAAWLSFSAFDQSTIYLSPAPLYHAAPLRFGIRCIASGGTVVVMKKFDALAALAAIERYRVTDSQWVPTMFTRLLALSPQQRQGHDLSSHRVAVHAAAPCPIDIKHQMLQWWGPIVWEYYTGSERLGATTISPQEWLERPGSVGRAAQGQRLHILDESRQECPPGVDGLVCFSGGPSFQYHGDPVKTAQAYVLEGVATFGDIGHVDAQGYLYLTDRRANMIISGGVNIYPQEAENLLAQHPLVLDVAVFGIPHADLGEEVKAVVELRQPALAGPATAGQLIEYCREHLAHLKCPRSVDFASDLPRTETGKLLKRLIRDQYRAQYHRRNPSS